MVGSNYEIRYRKIVSKKHIENLKAAKLDKNAKKLIEIIKVNPYQNPPEYEKLVGSLKGYYSRRINNKHRLVYGVDEENKIIKVISMWMHYEF